MKPLCDAPCLSLVHTNDCAGKSCLIERARKGNRAARELVFSKLYGPVLRQAQMLCRNHVRRQLDLLAALTHAFCYRR